MNGVMEALMGRCSVRKYSGESIDDAALEQVIRAGLLSASSRAIRPWEFIVVRDKALLAKMAGCRAGQADMLKGADCAIVVIGDGSASDVWVEDCSIAMANMHLMAHSLGLGSCWIQGRLRNAADGRSAEDFLRELLGFPEAYRLEAVLSIGMPTDEPKERDVAGPLASKVHYGRY